LLYIHSVIPPPPRSTLFPYTTLFRSLSKRHSGRSQLFKPFQKAGFVRGIALERGFTNSYEGAENKPLAVADGPLPVSDRRAAGQDRKSTRLNSSHLVISYAVFCLKKK